MPNTDTVPSEATRWVRIRRDLLIRSIAAVCAAAVMGVGVIVGRNTDRYWVTLLAIVGGCIVWYIVVKAANKRWS